MPSTHFKHDASINVGLTASFPYRLCLTRNVLAADNTTLVRALVASADMFDAPCEVPLARSPNLARTLFFVDDNLPPKLHHRIREYAQTHHSHIQLAGPIHTVPGGEQCKNDWKMFDTVCRAIHDAHLCRQSYVVAIGGGAVLDLVGFAASTVHRGVRFVRVPTTTLAQADAGVGVKNGINAFGKKNFLGTFSPPWAVIMDAQLLDTLSDRDWRSGFSEVIKISLVKDRTFFEQIVASTPKLMLRDMDTAQIIVRRSAHLHLQHITEGNDPFETGSGRPLDFGHWAAHKIEQLSNYRLRHGEAVAIGIGIDVMYSAIIGLLSWFDAQRIKDALTGFGFVLTDNLLHDGSTLLEGLDEFREHLGGPLTVTLLTGIGRSIDVHEMDRQRLLEAIEQLAAEPTWGCTS